MNKKMLIMMSLIIGAMSSGELFAKSGFGESLKKIAIATGDGIAGKYDPLNDAGAGMTIQASGANGDQDRHDKKYAEAVSEYTIAIAFENDIGRPSGQKSKESFWDRIETCLEESLKALKHLRGYIDNAVGKLSGRKKQRSIQRKMYQVAADRTYKIGMKRRSSGKSGQVYFKAAQSLDSSKKIPAI